MACVVYMYCVQLTKGQQQYDLAWKYDWKITYIIFIDVLRRIINNNKIAICPGASVIWKRIR